ncbi:MAG: diguanylate cyclase [Coprococcus sp.]|nr:diguanylate cyclase [Coprococcus sp.]
MKQFHFAYHNNKALLTELARIKRFCDRFEGNQAVFEIYTKELDEKRVREITDVIEEEMPDAYYYGCLSCGNILDGELTGADTIIVCLIFEYDTTSFRITQLSCSDPDYNRKLQDLIDYCNSSKWIKSIEILTTAKMLDSGFLNVWSEKLNPQLHCVGGCSSNPINEQSDDTYVFSKGVGFSDDAATFVMVGGEDLYVCSTYVLGYEPMGRVYEPTSMDGAVIHALNGQPAFEVYKRYLKIENNEHFFYNALGFPMIMRKDGVDYLRVPIAVLKDNSLVMSGEIEEGSSIRLSYGNPSIILRNIDKVGGKLATIGPEAIRIYSCFTRKLYWGDDNISKETENFAALAPATGFFTRGEILRIGRRVSNLNATLVVIGLREGALVPIDYHSMFEASENSGMLSYEDRLINFIGEATRELEAANRELARTSIMDGFTKLYNRTEIQRRITQALENSKKLKDNMALIMLDIDNFKRVNDTYGHSEGDAVIKGLSAILSEIDNNNEYYFAGRWGGEEFMLLVEKESEQKIWDLAEEIRKDFASLEFPKAGRQSVSVGITTLQPDDTIDSICVRIDKALYQAKSNGKNRVEKL